MTGLKMFTLITKRDFLMEYIKFFKQHGVTNVLTSMCVGTATDSVLSVLGIERTEKVMFKGVILEDKFLDFKNGLYQDMNIGDSGNGVAVFIPLDGIGGQFSKKYLVGDYELNGLGEKKMKENLSNNVLIITIADIGNSEKIMDAARSAGATGGTVAKANGTGADMAKFFGVFISEEKEMVYIVAKREQRDDIMRAIMNEAGANTNAHGVVFSLPIDSVVGIKGLE
ncbi:MAG: P-II family nitrogen regulator [Clostridia bacterium]|nr:P-II family nitrogen regulator [Clostridia bacterium]